MTAIDLRFAAIAFVTVSSTVAVNMLVFQEKRVRGGIETSAIKPRSAFVESMSAAINSDLGPPLAPGAAAIRVVPPKAGSSDSAEVIRGIQRELNQRGYDVGAPDGVAGLVTRAAIMAYEHDVGLPLTATPSQDLLSRIVLGSSAPAPARAAANGRPTAEADSVTRSVEQQLSALGYAPGKIDGNADEATARAIREFEIDQKLPESGRISGVLVGRLIRLQGQPGLAGENGKSPALVATKAQADAAKAASASAPIQKPKSNVR
jgi:peptidoglycan hydrolase-like protein with peptidoglycan-binding domain